ncbi:Cellulase (glycosyl hydrolase family 5) [Mariniphaga anaerophila]|uniref:Cellulase (Glycosyl hydrolase family 5) n=1 Tax=Mariniphaga anaerophila TaxID=1484053 RepID=A0A1M5EGA8_9BACT|nr:cellulase family glycosylhydrolase [Mariniphaga anaerophila]SHF78259.1 Cellulase (glycosyl hydrolase family 5) [Mariniphaga anaerophila]
MKATSWLAVILMVLNIGCTSHTDNGIKIYPEQPISTDYIGNGVQWSAYPHADTENAEWGKLMTDGKWDMNYKRLDYMQPKLFRVLDQANWRYMVGFDEKGEPILDFDTPEVKAVEKILDYAQKNNITVLLGEWGTPYKMHDKDQGNSDKFTGANDPKWINAIVEYLDYLINTKGYTCLKYYNLVNEPNGDWASTKGDFNEWRDGVILLSKALKDKGLDRHISVAGPDAVTRYDNPRSTYSGLGWVEETARQIDENIGIYEIHDYTAHDLVKSGEFELFHKKAADIAASKNKQIIFGELGMNRSGQLNQDRAKADPYASEDSQMEVYDHSYGVYMADAVIQSMNAGFSGAAAWALDDAMHTMNDLGNKNELKRWGMWNSLGTEICNNPDDENIRPWFYPWSLVCRYFPGGTSIVKTDSTGIDGVRLTAGVFEDDVTVAVVNNSDVDNVISLNIPTSKAMQKFLYVEGESKLDDNGFPVAAEKNIKAKKALKVAVPSNSFVLLTTLDD